MNDEMTPSDGVTPGDEWTGDEPSATPLSELTTMRVGGIPEMLIAPADTDALVAAAREVWASGEDWLLLGGGSNTVASDEGFDGTVIHARTRGVERLDAPDGRIRLRVQAGEPFLEFGEQIVEDVVLLRGQEIVRGGAVEQDVAAEQIRRFHREQRPHVERIRRLLRERRRPARPNLE